jgi:monothiol glutaredoxin
MSLSSLRLLKSVSHSSQSLRSSTLSLFKLSSASLSHSSFHPSSHFSTASSSAATLSSDDSHSDFQAKRPPTPSSSNSTSSVSLEDAKKKIQDDINNHSVFLYMKGTPTRPECGYSANVVRILSTYPGLQYGSRNVLADPFVREAIKTFSDWPTLPQLFVKGEFVGGSDIISEMYKKGELDSLLGVAHK